MAPVRLSRDLEAQMEWASGGRLIRQTERRMRQIEYLGRFIGHITRDYRGGRELAKKALIAAMGMTGATYIQSKLSDVYKQSGKQRQSMKRNPPGISNPRFVI